MMHRQRLRRIQMKLKRPLDKVIWVKSGQFAKRVVRAGQQKRAVQAGPQDRSGSREIHHIRDEADFVDPSDRPFPLRERLVPEAEHAIVMFDFRFALEAFSNPR